MKVLRLLLVTSALILGLAAAPAATGAAPAAPMTSGTTCEGAVCGKVHGTGLKVTSIDASAESTKSHGCQSPAWFMVRGTDVSTGTTVRTRTGPSVCPVKLLSHYAYGYTFKNNVPDGMPVTCPVSRCTLVVLWDTFDGTPQFDIHK